MAQTLFDKLGLLVGASAHDLVNRALKAQSVAVMDEEIRRAGESQDQLDETLAAIEADLRINRKKAAGLNVDVARLLKDASDLLAAGNKPKAAMLVKQKQMKQAALDKTNAALADAEKDQDSLNQARAALETKIEELKTSRDFVQQALEQARTKNRTVKTIEDIADVLGDTSPVSVEWAEGLKTKADVKLEMTLNKYGALMDAEEDPSVAAELTRMEADLAAQK